MPMADTPLIITYNYQITLYSSSLFIRAELIEEPKADDKAASREDETNDPEKNPEKDITSHAGQDLFSGPPAMVSSSKIKKNNKTLGVSPLYKEQDEEGGDTESD